jgi:hypothetical protein
VLNRLLTSDLVTVDHVPASYEKRPLTQMSLTGETLHDLCLDEDDR